MGKVELGMRKWEIEMMKSTGDGETWREGEGEMRGLGEGETRR